MVAAGRRLLRSESARLAGPCPTPPSKAIGQGPVNNPNALGRTVRGFGGFFYDAAGTPTMYLKDAGQRGNAERALAPYLQSHGVAASRIQVKAGRFTWDELEAWQAKASVETLKLPGAVFVDADEAGNQIKIGVERGKGGQVRAALARLGLPANAAVVEETEPVTFAVAPRPKPGGGSSLQGRVRPTEGRDPDQLPGLPLHARLQRQGRHAAELHHQLPLHQRAGRRGQHPVLAAAPERRQRADRHRGRGSDLRGHHRVSRRAALPARRRVPGPVRRCRDERRLREDRQDRAARRKARSAITGQFTITGGRRGRGRPGREQGADAPRAGPRARSPQPAPTPT